jgi:hypothetical protein
MGEFTFQDAFEGQHAGLAVGDVVPDEKHFHREGALRAASRGFIRVLER